MKKRVTALVLALALSLGMCVSASAASFVPDDVTYQNLNGQQLAIKVYTLIKTHPVWRNLTSNMMATYTHTAASLRRSRPSMSRIATQRL